MGFNYCTINDVKRQLLGMDMSDMPTSLISRIEDTYIPWAKRDVDTLLGYSLDLTQNYKENYDGTGTDVLQLRRKPVNRIRECILYVIPTVQWFRFMRPFQYNTREITGTEIAPRGGYEPIVPTNIPPYKVETLGDEGPFTGTFTDSEAQYGRSDLLIDCATGQLRIPPRILFLENQAVPFWNYTFLRGKGNIYVNYDYGYKDLDSLPKEFVNATALFAAAYILKDKAIWTSGGAQSINFEGVSRSFGNMAYDGVIKYMENKATELLKRRKKINVA